MTVPALSLPNSPGINPLPPQPPPAERSGLCGRKISSCGAHLIFALGYAVSGFGVLYAISDAHPVMGGVCSLALCVQVVAHRFWSQYASIKRATESIEGAALDANRAALEMQNVAQVGFHIAGRVVQAANCVELSSGRIAQTVELIASDDFQNNVDEVQGLSNDIIASSEHIETSVEDLRSTLAPLMGILATFRSSLKDIHREFAHIQPQIKEFAAIENRFCTAQQTLLSGVDLGRNGFQTIIQLIEEESLLTLQVLQENSRHIQEKLFEQNEQLLHTVSVLEEMTDRSQTFQLGMSELQKQIAFERKENDQLRVKLDALVVQMQELRSQWETEPLQRSYAATDEGVECMQRWTHLLELLQRMEGSVFLRENYRQSQA